MGSAFAVEAGNPATKTKADKLAINLQQRYRGVFHCPKKFVLFTKDFVCACL